MAKILVALDESPISLRAAREAERLFPGAEFVVVSVSRHVVPWIPAGSFGPIYPVTFADLTSHRPDEESIPELAEQAGLEDAEVLELHGDPASVICIAAEEQDVDAVVVGSHDKHLLRRLLEPSVAQAVVQGTHRPVVVVSGEPPTA